MPQTGLLEAGGKAEADIESTTLELPEGLLANASSANGLETCSVGAVGFTGGPEAPQPGELGGELATQNFTPLGASCPTPRRSAPSTSRPRCLKKTSRARSTSARRTPTRSPRRWPSTSWPRKKPPKCSSSSPAKCSIRTQRAPHIGLQQHAGDPVRNADDPPLQHAAGDTGHTGVLRRIHLARDVHELVLEPGGTAAIGLP